MSKQIPETAKEQSSPLHPSEDVDAGSLISLLQSIRSGHEDGLHFLRRYQKELFLFQRV